ncbi:hypothetical protein C0J45_19340 [Silurus meridionalis]|nr:hypothetical protein C0J45_19340 [Silurus meridionalis]
MAALGLNSRSVLCMLGKKKNPCGFERENRMLYGALGMSALERRERPKNPTIKVAQASALIAGPKPGLMGRVALGRASSVNRVPNRICGSRIRNSYRIGRGPGYQQPPKVSLANKVPVKIGLQLAEGGEGGRCLQRRQGKEQCRRVEVRVGTLNVGTMTGKGREVADMMERRKRNGVGVILKEEYSKRVVEVKRVSDRVMIVNLEVEGMMINVISAYAPQVCCEMEEKERFWSESDEVVDGVHRNERVVIGSDFNGHVGEGNRGDEEVMGRYGFKERNVEGQMVVDFAKRMEMAVVNTYIKKKEENRVKYKSGGRCTQVDYVLCRRCNLKEIGDCKVLAGDSVARQHRMVVCRMVLEMKKKRRRVRTERRIRWWKLKEEDCSVRFRKEVRQGLGGGEEVPDDWGTTAGVMREAARKVLGVTSGNRKQDKETWWWNEEVQESIRRKRLAKQKWDRQSDEKSRQEYKEMQQQVKKDVAKAKEKAYEELYVKLDTKEGEKYLYRLARQRDRAGKDVLQVRAIKDGDGNVLISEESVLRR